jgi:hypothetical protein
MRPYSHNLLALIAGRRSHGSLRKSDDGIAWWQNRPLFIDDGHYYETILEFELWKPRPTRAGSFLHDVNDRPTLAHTAHNAIVFRCPEFWKELQGNKREIIATSEHWVEGNIAAWRFGDFDGMNLPWRGS